MELDEEPVKKKIKAGKRKKKKVNAVNVETSAETFGDMLDSTENGLKKQLEWENKNSATNKRSLKKGKGTKGKRPTGQKRKRAAAKLF